MRSIVRVDRIQKLYLQEGYINRGFHNAVNPGVMVNRAIPWQIWMQKVGVINTGQTSDIETSPELICQILEADSLFQACDLIFALSCRWGDGCDMLGEQRRRYRGLCPFQARSQPRGLLRL